MSTPPRPPKTPKAPALPPVGSQLRAARLRQGRTLKDLARALGTNSGYLSAVETGAIRPPRVKKLLRWAQELGLNGEELALQAWALLPREVPPARSAHSCWSASTWSILVNSERWTI